MMYFDELQIRKTIAIMKPNNQLFEVRIVCGKKTISGYFREADTLISELKKQDLSKSNVYITLGVVHDACFSREQGNKFMAYTSAATSDNDILSYDWLMVDLDPKRPKDTSSSESEVKLAKDLGNKVYKFMEQLGFEKPLMAMSGNGVHLLYKIALKNKPHNTELVKRCLYVLDTLFSNNEVSVDVKNSNTGRVCKLYGTLANKGRHTKDRPHRMSYIWGDPTEIKENSLEYLEKLCSIIPSEPDVKRSYNNYNPVDFNLEEWMNKYGLNYRTASYSDGTKYILDCCPFDSNHKGKDAVIFKGRNGAIGFHCFHNSCADRKWQDVRLLFEPDAYEKKKITYEKEVTRNYNKNKPKPKEIVPTEDEPVWYTPKTIANKPNLPETFIKTGTTDLDMRMRGLKKGFVSLVSGLRGSAKSTWLNGVILNAIEEGYNVGVYSGELSDRNFMRWLKQQAAGKSKVEESQYEGFYNVPKQYQEQIDEWLENKLFLYNNNHGNNFCAIIKEVRKAIETLKLDVVVLDNLMSLDIREMSDNKWDAQTQFVWAIHELTNTMDVHIIFVAHPRKAMGFLRLDDISGSADLSNAVENAFIVHRVNNDFKRLTKQMFSWYDDDPVYQATNVIEICKDRDGGNQDIFIPLFYEVETRRLKNYRAENKIYSWDSVYDGFQYTEEEPVFN